MPRYINADKIISYMNDEIEACGDPDVDFQPVVYGTYLGLKSLKSFIETAETADVVEVVWCKDCKYLERTDCFGECSLFKDRDEPRGEMLPNDFCSYGKMRK